MENWKSEKLENVCEVIQRGIAPKYINNDGVLVLNQKCIRDHVINYELARRHDISQRRVSPDRYIKKGDVLINSTGTGTLGRVAQVRCDAVEPATVDTHVTIVRPLPGLFFEDFFGYALIDIEEEIMQRGEGTSGQTELSRNAVKNLVITFPSNKEEQKRVVKILDSALNDIQKIVKNTEDKLSSLKVLKKSIFKKAFSGALANHELIT